MKKIILGMGMIAILSKLTGFGRDLALSYFYGVSEITDAYLVAISIPTVIFNFIGLGLLASYMPMYNHIKKIEGQQGAFNFTTNFLNFLMLTCTIIYFLGLIFTVQVVKIFASGFEGELLLKTVFFTRICLSAIYASILVNIFSGFLQNNNVFYLTALVGVPTNIIYIIGTYIAHENGDIFLPIMSVIAIFSQFFLLIYPIKKTNYKYSFKLDMKDSHLKEIIILSIPTIIGSSLEQINYLIDKTIASKIMIGGITIINYANRLNIAIISLFVSSIFAVFFPKISSLVAEKKIEEMKKIVKETTVYIFIISIPIVFGILILSNEIVNFIFVRGSFSNEMGQLTSNTLFYYIIGFIPMAVRELIARIFYSFKDTKTPVINSSIGIVLNIVLNITLSKYMGITGIALATSISLTTTTILLTINLSRKYGDFYFKDIIITFFKILFSSICMCLIILIIKNKGTLPKNINLFCSILAGGIFYIISILFLNIKEIKEIKKFILK